MADLDTLRAYRERLLDTRYSGVRTVTDSNGESLTYRSQSEIETAIAALDSEIAALTRKRSGVIYPMTSKGVL